MNQQTKVQNIQIRVKTSRLRKTEEKAKVLELPERQREWGRRILQLDKLVRDFAVVGGLMLVVIAVRNAGLPETQSVFGVLQESAGMQWDESLGKLSFVNSFLPETVREVWSTVPYADVAAKIEGEIVHAWSNQEPYLLIDNNTSEIRVAAAGEVMSIAHGPDEEYILRLRHGERTETIYGNLQEINVEIGQYVEAGEIVGKLLHEQPLAFEIRVDGRSVDPVLQQSIP